MRTWGLVVNLGFSRQGFSRQTGRVLWENRGCYESVKSPLAFANGHKMGMTIRNGFLFSLSTSPVWPRISGKFLNAIRRDVCRKPPIQSSELSAPTTDSSLCKPELASVEAAVIHPSSGLIDKFERSNRWPTGCIRKGDEERPGDIFHLPLLFSIGVSRLRSA